MELEALAGMVFTLIIIAMVGGFILLFPLTRRLGELLEQRLKGTAVAEGSQAEIRQLEAAVRGLREELERLTERQTFTESLLSERDPLLLPEDRRKS